MNGWKSGISTLVQTNLNYFCPKLIEQIVLGDCGAASVDDCVPEQHPLFSTTFRACYQLCFS